MNFHVRCLRKLTKDEEYHLDSQETCSLKRKRRYKVFSMKRKGHNKMRQNSTSSHDKNSQESVFRGNTP